MRESDARFRQHFEALLAALEHPDELLATQAEAARPTLEVKLTDEPADEAVGQTLGRYNTNCH